MGQNSRFVIQHISFDAQTHHGSMVGQVLHGTMPYVIGLIARANSGGMEVHTAAATVGIRGTGLLVDVPAEESPQ